MTDVFTVFEVVPAAIKNTPEAAAPHIAGVVALEQFPAVTPRTAGPELTVCPLQHRAANKIGFRIFIIHVRMTTT